MREEKSVYKALFSEQEPKKVELGVADDIQKMIAEGEKGLTELTEALKEALQVKKDFAKIEQTALKHRSKSIKTAAKFEKLVDKIENTLNKVENQADDLGVSPSAIKGFDKAMSVATDVLDLADDLKRFDYNIGQ